MKIQFMPRWRKKKIAEKIIREYRKFTKDIKCKSFTCEWLRLMELVRGSSLYLERVKAVRASPLLRITIGNRVFEVSPFFRFSTCRFQVFGANKITEVTK